MNIKLVIFNAASKTSAGIDSDCRKSIVMWVNPADSRTSLTNSLEIAFVSWVLPLWTHVCTFSSVCINKVPPGFTRQANFVTLSLYSSLVMQTYSRQRTVETMSYSPMSSTGSGWKISQGTTFTMFLNSSILAVMFCPVPSSSLPTT